MAKTTKYRIWQAVWMALAFVPWVGGAGLLIAGVQAHRPRWAYIGAVMLLPIVASIAYSGAVGSDESDDVSTALALVAWGVAIWLAFRYRRQWLEAVEPGWHPGPHETSLQAHVTSAPRPSPARPPPPPTASPSYGLPTSPGAVPPPPAQSEAGMPSLPSPAVAAGPRLGINSATDSELRALRALPSSTVELVIAARTSSGPFRSVEDLAARTTLKPHELELLLRVAAVDVAGPARPRAGGRVVDF